MKKFRDVLGCPRGWDWSESWVIDNIRFIHGEGFGGRVGAIAAAEAYHQPVVIGHLHAYAGVQYSSSFTEKLWGVNSGCLIDREKYAFAYAKTSKHKPVLGVTVNRCTSVRV